MTAIWDGIQRLNGRTLKTLAQGREFDIINVSHDRIEFVPKRGKGTRRWIGREWTEQAAGLNLAESELTPSRLSLEFPNDQNLSYMAAILHAAKR